MPRAARPSRRKRSSTRPSRHSPKSSMNIDIFLPFHRKTKKGEEAPKPTRLGRVGRAIFPTTFFSDPATGKKGLVRRVLQNIGTTWHSSPWRRVIQAGFFAAFLLFFCYVCWPYGGTNYAAHRESKEKVPAETFLIIDPLVALSTAIASRGWVWSLTAAGIILAVCVFVPRGFCGYVCPLGTVIDLFDWAVGKRVKRWKLKDETRGWWVNLKYYLLVACLVAGMCGILLTGFVAAIPVITRAMLFLVSPLQMGATRGFYQVPAWNWGHAVSIALFAAVLGLGLLQPEEGGRAGRPEAVAPRVPRRDLHRGGFRILGRAALRRGCRRRLAEEPPGAAAGQRGGEAVPRAVHPLRRVLPGLPQQ